jgi:phage terminase large subunit
MTIQVPFNFTPRDYQKPFYNALKQGYKRMVIMWNRRSGKDKTCIAIIAKEMIKRVGTYFYVFPTYAQGKKVLWNGRDKEGFRFIEHIPKSLWKTVDNTAMRIELKNGSVFQIVGSDNIDSLVGTNPIGIVFSEYSLQNPDVWSFLRPILDENDGWAIFNFTPRGENHAKGLYDMAKNSVNWFTSLLTVEDTKTVPIEKLEQIRLEYIAEHGDDALFYQEFYCSFDSPIQGAYYAKQLSALQHQVRDVPYNSRIPVHTSWDLGKGENNAIWFFQLINSEIHVIDCMAGHGKALPDYIAAMSERGYVFGNHYAPHDIESEDYSTGRSRIEIAKQNGVVFRVVAKLKVEDGIAAVRELLPRCYFDKNKCREGLNALKHYHASFSDRLKTFRDYPEHDWSSHFSDSFRYLAVGIREPKDYKEGETHVEEISLDYIEKNW